MNLASKSAEYRAKVEAEKHCHFIRHQCGKLEGWQRQACARKLLGKHGDVQRKMIEAAMRVEADKK